jgi:CheY-like chemotaxis protein
VTEDAREARPTPEKTVLYIEDNPSNIRLVATILERRPAINLISAHQPRVGLDLAREYAPDLILLDINMPGLNGYEVLERLRADRTFDDTPIIAVTANAMASEVREGMAAGFDDYLTKPLDVGRFLETLDDVLFPASEASNNEMGRAPGQPTAGEAS